MIEIENIKKGHTFRLNDSYPVYGEIWDRNGEYEPDEIVGYLSPNNVAEVTYIEKDYKNKSTPIIKISDELVLSYTQKVPDGWYVELKLLSGEYKGYDGLALNEKDMERASFVTKFKPKEDSL